MVTSRLVDDMIRAEMASVRLAANPFADGVLIEARSVVAQGDIDLDTEITEDNLDDIKGLLEGVADDFDASAEEDAGEGPEDAEPDAEPESEPEGGEDMEPEAGSGDPLDVASRAVDMVLEILRYPSARVASAAEDVLISSELLEAKADPKSITWFREQTTDAQKSFCSRFPDSELCGGKGITKKKDEGSKGKPKKEDEPKGEGKKEPKEETPESEKKESPEESKKPASLHPKNISDGPFEFESRKEKPMSKAQHDKWKSSGAATVLSTLRGEFEAAGRGAMFDKRIGAGTLSKSDAAAIEQAINDATGDKGAFNKEKAVGAIAAHLFKPAGGAKPKDEPKEEKKPEPKKEDVEDVEGELVPAPKEEKKPEEKKDEPKEEKKPEPPKEEKKEAPAAPAKKTPYGEAKSQGKHHLVDDKNPLDFKDVEGMKGKGFKEPKPGNHKLSDNSMIIDPKSGERYKFGDLPKETQDKVRKIVESKGAWMAPKKKGESKKEEPAAKKEEPKESPATKKEDKPKSKPLSDKLEKARDKVRGVIDKVKDLGGLGKELAKHFSPKSLGKAFGKGVGKAHNFGKHMKKVMTKKNLKDKYVGTKKKVKDLLNDIVDSMAEGMQEGYASTQTASARMASADEVVAALIADRVVRWAARGMQTKRKDKDMMRDTGGDSKGRQRQPWAKPPREDLMNRTGPKHKTPEQRDPDTDNDPDLKKSFDEEVEEAMILM